MQYEDRKLCKSPLTVPVPSLSVRTGSHHDCEPCPKPFFASGSTDAAAPHAAAFGLSWPGYRGERAEIKTDEQYDRLLAHTERGIAYILRNDYGAAERHWSCPEVLASCGINYDDLTEHYQDVPSNVADMKTLLRREATSGYITANGGYMFHRGASHKDFAPGIRFGFLIFPDYRTDKLVRMVRFKHAIAGLEEFLHAIQVNSDAGLIMRDAAAPSSHWRPGVDELEIDVAKCMAALCVPLPSHFMQLYCRHIHLTIPPERIVQHPLFDLDITERGTIREFKDYSALQIAVDGIPKGESRTIGRGGDIRIHVPKTCIDGNGPYIRLERSRDGAWYKIRALFDETRIDPHVYVRLYDERRETHRAPNLPESIPAGRAVELGSSCDFFASVRFMLTP